MKICYVANHQSGRNDDESAIAYALELLGHRVMRVSESTTKPLPIADLLLCHHWGRDTGRAPEPIKRYTGLKAFWAFDMIYHNDGAREHRSERNQQWRRNMTVVCNIGFLTDGDDISKSRNDKLHWLMQGADIRTVGYGAATEYQYDILFAGTGERCGKKRLSFVREMHQRYGNRFLHVPYGIYRRDLADLIASCRLVVAPDSPVTDLYWSNRVYMTCGFGACLLHPHCAGLLNHYGSDELTYYTSRNDLHEKIDNLLKLPEMCAELRKKSLACTLRDHTYVKRCEELLRIVGEHL